MRSIITVSLVLIAIACGSITINLDTEVRDETQIFHAVGMQATGQVAELMSGELDPNEMSEGCTASYEQGTFDLSCPRITDEEMRSQDVGDTSFDIEVTKSDHASFTEYRVSMPNPFLESRAELQGNPMADNLDAIIKLRFYWTVSMPGDIVETESNADTFDGNKASFNVSLDDARDAFTVISRQSKSGGLFSCN